MSKEERKAIEDITREITDEDRKEYMSKWFLDDLTILIKLIEKQQKEIEKNKNFIDFLQLNDVKKLGEIIKKDKIIDLMAEYINELDIDEDICSKNIINSDICNEQYSNCKACIKQYFERKGEEDK